MGIGAFHCCPLSYYYCGRRMRSGRALTPNVRNADLPACGGQGFVRVVLVRTSYLVYVIIRRVYGRLVWVIFELCTTSVLFCFRCSSMTCEMWWIQQVVASAEYLQQSSHCCWLGSLRATPGLLFFVFSLMRLFKFSLNETRQPWSPWTEWLKLSFASCVMHRTRSLGVLILHLIFIYA